MGNEATKSKVYFGILEKKVFNGKGIDIGCGKDPVFKDVKSFDVQDGDANEITNYVKEKFDFVFSSHCLEHMKNPFYTIKQWYQLVKDKGYLYIFVPDEDLYEKRKFPSKYNDDHKWTFSVLKQTGATLRTINIIELLAILPDARIMKIETQDYNYDYNLANGGDQTLGNTTAQICFCVQKNKDYKNIDYKFKENRILKNLYYLINCFFVNILILINIMTSKLRSLFR